MKTRREYTVRERRVDDYYYTVEASSKAEAIRKVEECVADYGEMYGHKTFKPVVERIQDYDECPNRGEGWSEIPLDDLKDIKMDSFDWYYNGKCGGEKQVEDTHCSLCRSAMRAGRRLLTNEEKLYLNEKHATKFNVEAIV